MGGAPEGHPSIVSRLIGTDYTAQVCEKAFPSGKLNSEFLRRELSILHFLDADLRFCSSCSGVPSTPNITAINQWGSFKLQHSRLAFIDGSDDRTLRLHPPRLPR